MHHCVQFYLLQGCFQVAPQICGKSLSLACKVFFPTILTNTNIPTPSRGEDKCWCSCQGQTRCREVVISKVSESEEAHLSGAGETQVFTHSSSHKSTINIIILHPSDGQSWISFSFRTCNLNSFIPFRASFS